MATSLKSYKVNSLPATPDANSVYYVKSGDGFDVVVTDNSGNPKYLYREPKQFIFSSSATPLLDEHINATIFLDSGVSAIAIHTANLPLPDNFECFLNNNSGGDVTIQLRPNTGWTYSVNNAAPISNGNITLLDTGQCSVLREMSNKLIYVLGDVQ